MPSTAPLPEISNKGLSRWVYLASRLMDKLAGIVLFAMMILTVSDVIGRKFFHNSILGTVELSEFMLVFVVLFSLAYTEWMDGHVRVDLVMSWFGTRIRTAVDMMTRFISLVMTIFFSISAFVYAGKMRLAGEVSQDLLLPKYPFVYLVGFGFAILGLTLLTRFLTALKETFRP